ncbi:MAG: class I SAM-dependent methyltransferase [Burkholderiales bacterium]
MTTGSNDLAAYYAKRAGIFDQIYEKPECQADLAVLQQRLCEVLAGHRVLELACGTGYWTQRYAHSAESVLATDINPEMLALAQAKDTPAGKVRWERANAFEFQTKESFSACFAGFWWSHVMRQDQEGFLQHLRRQCGKDTLLVLMDNVYVEGSSTTIARTDLEGNTFQIRTLPDGERHEILKNFPTDSALRKKLAAAVRDIRILRLEHYWMLTCRLK